MRLLKNKKNWEVKMATCVPRILFTKGQLIGLTAEERTIILDHYEPVANLVRKYGLSEALMPHQLYLATKDPESADAKRMHAFKDAFEIFVKSFVNDTRVDEERRLRVAAYIASFARGNEMPEVAGPVMRLQ
jgi:hypothetical protein